jgi:hypothetical protein
MKTNLFRNNKLPLLRKGLGGRYSPPCSGDESFAARPYTQNDPKKLVCRIPALAAGAYTLNIVTRYSNSSVLLKALRTIIYEQPLTVG